MKALKMDKIHNMLDDCEKALHNKSADWVDEDTLRQINTRMPIGQLLPLSRQLDVVLEMRSE